MTIVVAVLALLVLVAVLGVAAAGVLALRNKASYEKESELMPGVTTSAPPAWAGSHDPEARLHRRLRDAMAALAANQAFDDDGALLDLRVELQQQAVALDEQLVAASALPLHLRAEPLSRIGAVVDTIEQAIADLANASVAEAGARLSRVVADVAAHTGLVAQARAALDELDATTPTGDLSPTESTEPTEPKEPGTAGEARPGT